MGALVCICGGRKAASLFTDSVCGRPGSRLEEELTVRAGNEATRGSSLLTPVIFAEICRIIVDGGRVSLCLISILAADVEPDQSLISFVPSSIFLAPPLKSGDDFHTMTDGERCLRLIQGKRFVSGRMTTPPPLAAPYFTDTG